MLLKLPTLPQTLVQLELSICSQLRRISTMSHMKKLEILNPSGCTSLAELPELKSLESITELQLYRCRELVEVPTLPKGLINVNLKRLFTVAENLHHVAYEKVGGFKSIWLHKSC
eukprot:Gb_29340 [translate_table: standard]